MAAWAAGVRAAARIIPASFKGYPCARMLDDVRKYVRLGLEALSSQAAQSSEEVGDAVRSRTEAVAAQLSTLAAGFLEWSAEARASLVQEIKDLVSRQVEEMGVATKKDLETLRARLDRLEGRLQGAGQTGAARGAATRRKPAAAAKRKGATRIRAGGGTKGKATGSGRAARGPR